MRLSYDLLVVLPGSLLALARVLVGAAHDAIGFELCLGERLYGSGVGWYRKWPGFAEIDPVAQAARILLCEAAKPVELRNYRLDPGHEAVHLLDVVATVAAPPNRVEPDHSDLVQCQPGAPAL